MLDNVLLCVLMFFSSYGFSQSSLPSDRYVIIPFQKILYCPLPANSIPASLNDSDFLTIDQVLTECIDQYNLAGAAVRNEDTIKKYPHRSVGIDLTKYYRQYMVAQNTKGEKEVWVNCLCTVQYMESWRIHFVQVLGGGKCFFNLRINLTSKSYSDFQVNAPK